MRPTYFKRKETESPVKLRFNLKQIQQADRPTQIMLSTTVNRRRIRVYTRLRVEPKYWDKDSYRCRPSGDLTLRERQRLKSINEQIDLLTYYIYEADGLLAARGEYLTAAVVRRTVLERLEHERRLQDPIACLRRLAEDYEKQVNRNGQRGIGSTKVTYLTALHRLEDYNRRRPCPIRSFEEFNRKFFEEFTNYLYGHTYGKNGKHYTRNTVVNTLKVIKNMLHRAYDEELTTNNYYHKVQTTLPSNTSEQVYLQEKEIRKLAAADTDNDQEREVRDMFVIACYTALRISDIQQLKNAVIRKGVISLYQKKTKDLVEIPILKEIASLVEHYQQIGFPVIDRARANGIIRKLAARCRINEMVSYKEQRGGETMIVSKPKCDMISFHTARRSCITNLYKRGYPANYVMTLSGHKSMQAFQRYMKASNNELMASFVNMLKKDKAILV